MALVPCAECGTEISDKAAACPKCGAKPKRSLTWLWWVIGLFCAIIFIGVVAGSTPEAKARARDKEAIELCWRGQKDPTFEPATARFIASTCQKMESDYTAKYGSAP
jgi:hypothetical protein